MTAPVRVRPGTYLVLLPDGVEAWTRHGRTFLAGTNTRQWTERLKPLLDGDFTRAQIVAMVPAQRRSTARKLLDALTEVGVLEDGAPTYPPVEELAAAGPVELEVALDPSQHDAGHARQLSGHHRPTTAVVVGSCTGVDDVIDGLVLAGLKAVRDVVDRLEQVGRATMTFDVGVVVHVVESSSANEIAQVERHCQQSAIPLVQLVLDRRSAWWQDPGSTARWSDVRARLAGLRRPGAIPDPVHDWSREPLRAVMANQVAQSILHFVTGRDTRHPSPRMVEWSPLDLTKAERSPRAHPFDVVVGPDDDVEFVARMTDLENRPAVDPERFSEQALELMDNRVGVFTDIEHGNLPQVPLATGTCSVADPVGLGDGTGTPSIVTCSDLDLGRVRRRIAMRSLAEYAGRLFDPRRCVDVSPGFQEMAVTDPWAAARELRAGRARARVQAFDMLERRVVRLDACGVVVPVAGSGTSAATGVGWNWGAALQDGLLQHCERRARDELAVGNREPRRIGLPSEARTEQAARLVRSVEASPETLEIYDVTSHDLVPAVLCVVGDVAFAVGCGVDHLMALDRCLNSALHAVQLGTGHNGHGPTTSPRASRVESFPVFPPLGVDDLIRALRGDRRGPLVVPLDHDPAVTAVLPAILRVVHHD